MADKIHMSVVRDTGYQRGEFNTRGRHNERKNEEYGNGDIVPERIPLNVHFHQNFKANGDPETYDETYSRLLATGAISEKWQKPDSAQFAEMVFDVNTEYFDEYGGYEYAKSFYKEAYRFALKEIGSEEYIISAVLHADERHSTLSEQLGRDVFHYHLHVVYVPVVEKRDYFSKDYKKDPSLAGKLKEVYMQVAHSKKWPIKVPIERDGKKIFVNSYSLLQDRYFEHMRAAGFDGFERGERGSTAEHLEVLDYKIQQDKKRLDVISEQVKRKEAQADKLDEQITVKEKARATIDEIDTMGHTLPLVPGVHFTDEEAKKLKSLARKGAGKDKRAATLNKKITELEGAIRDKDGEVSDMKRSYSTVKVAYDGLYGEVKDFIPAIRKIPNRLRGFIEEQKLSATKTKEASL